MRQITAGMILITLALQGADTPATLSGYSQRAAESEIGWERKFRAIPQPDRLREYMRRLSARPHHIGSPYDKDNAEWILAQLKSWGLDAKIEVFDTLFPTPLERSLELLEPFCGHQIESTVPFTKFGDLFGGVLTACNDQVHSNY